MQTQITDTYRNADLGREADAILRKCVHCGFCTATCPTYQLLGDELDGPRGRIYQIKALLEGAPPTEKVRTHLDRCLTCRSCETTCPSGVPYHHLLDIGRQLVDQGLQRPLAERLTRWALRETLTRPWLFGPAVKLGQMLRPVLPGGLGDKLPPALPEAPPIAVSVKPGPQVRRMLILEGCVQPTLAPGINHAARRVLGALGIELIHPPGPAKVGCCGALRFHLDDVAGARQEMQRNIDAWWPLLAAGEAEALVVTASGCGAHVKDYGHLLADDPAYAERAAQVSALARDVADVVSGEVARLAEDHDALAGFAALLDKGQGALPVAFHAPCTLQHGLKIRGVVESLLTAAGYTLTPVADGHLCCGSAGTYSLLQPELSHRLRDQKLANLQSGSPQVIATANIGCLTHLQAGSDLPVKHWIELVADRLRAP